MTSKSREAQNFLPHFFGCYQALEGALNFINMDTKDPEVTCSSDDIAMNDFLAEFQSETDRAAAVLGPAMLDDLLKQLLTCSMSSPLLAEKLLETGRPLGTFSARITTAQAFGLISDSEAKDLNRLREIRNKFAHKLHGLTFSDQSIKDSCQHFSCIISALSESTDIFSSITNNGRYQFNIATALLAMSLTRRISDASPANKAVPFAMAPSNNSFKPTR